ncbi:nudix hydrolase [Stylonychia lemnae]|uniref:Nudix hydrolase n=1 Tax=Stylonychia lemnae TaxID=5949 RepID=A0A078AJE6_STYLE|nr:nudix hydrolase [Stylonychia lemnae]|eukprot:CDW82011.1 nudix hydrolase [Stylonychia lemnae]
MEFEDDILMYREQNNQNNIFFYVRGKGTLKLVRGISCIIFNNKPNLNKEILNSPLQVLLIQREKDPYKGRWCFPGGSLEPNETLREGVKREVQEELGYEIEVFSGSDEIPDYLNKVSRGDIHYEISAFAGYLHHQQKKVPSEDLINRWFLYPDEINQLKDEECLPKLKDILNEVASKYFDSNHLNIV